MLPGHLRRKTKGLLAVRATRPKAWGGAPQGQALWPCVARLDAFLAVRAARPGFGVVCRKARLSGRVRAARPKGFLAVCAARLDAPERVRRKAENSRPGVPRPENSQPGASCGRNLDSCTAQRVSGSVAARGLGCGGECGLRCGTRCRSGWEWSFNGGGHGRRSGG